MKTVILLAGLPAVGKSTIARHLARRLGGEVLDVDRIKRTIVDPALVVSTIDPPSQRWRCYEIAAQEILQYLSETGTYMIVDEVFHLESLRSQLEDMLTAQGVRVRWVEVRSDYETVNRRLMKTARTGHILSRDQSLRMYTLFEEIFEPFPHAKENHQVFVNDDASSVDTIVI